MPQANLFLTNRLRLSRKKYGTEFSRIRPARFQALTASIVESINAVDFSVTTGTNYSVLHVESASAAATQAALANFKASITESVAAISTQTTGGSAYDSAGQDAAWNAAFITRNSKLGTIPAGSKYVATAADGGSDSNTGNSFASPYLTIGKALDNLGSSKTVVVKAGVYTGAANWVSSAQRSITSGSAGNWTTIRAEVPFAVEITWSSAPSGYGDAPVNVGSGTSYVWIDGIGIDQTFTTSTEDGNDDTCFKLDGTHCRLTRWYSRRKSCDRYGGHVWYGGVDNFNVVQMGWFNGSYRYGIQGGPSDSESTGGKNVVSMVVGEGSFGIMKEPTALFNFYGSGGAAGNSGRQMLFANCYGIDSDQIPPQAGDGQNYGPFYFPKLCVNIRTIGCGIVNCGAWVGGFRSDSFDLPGAGGVFTALSQIDCFVAGMISSGVGAFTKGGFGTNVVNNCTIGLMTGGGPLTSGSAFSTSANLTSGATYPMVRQSGNGAEQKYPIGGCCRETDETGFDVVDTSLNLWPFPYETQMKAFFARTITKVTQDKGVSVTIDPFSGNDAFGNPKTFTRRAFQALTGTQEPSFAPGAGFYP